MHDMEKKYSTSKAFAVIFVAALVLSYLCPTALAQNVLRGTITGTVTADEGQVRAFRVAAHNLDSRLWYTVFTKNGHYTVPQALPGLYEITVEEPGYSSPKLPVVLTSGDTKNVDIALKKTAIAQRAGPTESSVMGGPAAAADTAKVVYVDSLEEVYPAGPGRDLLKADCTGCHSDTLSQKHFTVERFVKGIEMHTETGPESFPNVLALGRTVISNDQKQQLAHYLNDNFGPGKPARMLRQEPLVLDEDVASKAIFVSYDVPTELPFAQDQGKKIGAPMINGEVPTNPGPPASAPGHLQQGYISPVDGSVWFTARNWNSMLQLKPEELDPSRRWKNYPVMGGWVSISGAAIDSKGKVYWSELSGGALGELDPATGKQTRYVIPQMGVDVGVVVDKDDNIDFALIWGALFGRVDAKTRVLHTYPTPTPDNGIYGLTVDPQGNMWGAGWQKGTISEWDVKTGTVIEHFVPNSWGQIRRIGVDKKGLVWGSEYNSGYLVSLDPATNKQTEYKMPIGSRPYDAWPDNDDNIWTADDEHSVIAKLDQKTGKFTYYPMPQPHQSLPKFDVEKNNTLWFGTRGEPVVAGVHFYPDGYTAKAVALP